LEFYVSHPHDLNQPALAINRRRLVLSLLITSAFFALFMFWPAGNWAWPKGWLFTLVLLACSLLALAYIWRVNRELIAARINPHQGTKRWDKILLGFLFSTMLAIFLVAALDDGRFHWLPLPWWLCAIGYLLLVAAFVVITWAEGVNKFFEPTVRIQTDRGHKVVDSGPYAIVRHPGYVAATFLCAGSALSLGSLWALIPASLTCLTFIVRTRWEDQMLQAELPGYAAYARRVHYKWIPGVW
jgi:protein-S-isoprenylcysteine O-methyltransferase Ste14